ncbi:helix-turn-helix domain-containing protein [Pseudosulfitobacter pseudonitzschiae]|uniref:helix-turn-helix domain-containing protein n=1 Tax=Pseudosulfitobacter pseudonitzschiae TaxID=1402135 RepID=UPI001AFC3F92|nr:helix-turn-helix transcriptional regulator [Pseudosulfitobacter pseudonitzschiae]MBM1814570.1 helix-turn-helix transcriptional regulator [Pseudosulfitobacter pseudonitzschiae]MBM1831564.1 helix-turn-helix transcriptional regulator [Pseudosulfitobacter pseudonitzschiae]MBM1836429.1 helix-turn-helix transcriptional regulator [Pseudosulfitobacter pseudonitzschiae]MBM1841276.1 helix-turn-helix transcriptional regulator [Pseudosulfitobacter pseudonitzschiae]MBM1846143.1 helix-turn-helix transcri
MSYRDKSPAELRNMLGANLRHLAQNFPSISALSRQLGVNRTQFNRYLAGESFPRPDVLARICTFFDVDARILLSPVAEIGTDDRNLSDPYLQDFLNDAAVNVPETLFPSGFYRFSRRSFIDQNKFIVGLVHVVRKNGSTFIRGFEPREAFTDQGLPQDSRTREYRGLVIRQDDGIAAMVARRGAVTCSFNHLAREMSFENNFWVGYVARTVRETITTKRVERLVYEHLGTNVSKVLAAARTSGFCELKDLQPYHKRLLRPAEPFR